MFPIRFIVSTFIVKIKRFQLFKLCIAYSTGYIPPNLNYNVPREGVPSLASGRLQVVTEKQPWNRGMSGINSFGFGGANAHTLLKNVARPKVSVIRNNF